MKRITLGTVALLAVLAVVTVKLPSVLVAPHSGERGTASGKGRSLVLSQDMKPVTPLVVTRGVPSLPPLEPGLLDSHSLASDAQRADLEKAAEDASQDRLSLDYPPLPSPDDSLLAYVGETCPVEYDIRPHGTTEPEQATETSRQAQGTGARGVPSPREADLPRQESLRLAGTSQAPADSSKSDAADPSDAAASSETADSDERGAGAHDKTEAGASNGIDTEHLLRKLLGEISITLAGVPSPGLSVANAAQAPREPAESRGLRNIPAVSPGQQSLRDSGEAEKPQTGFVLLDVAMRRHPSWGELAILEQEMDACKADWQRQVDSSHLTEVDIAACYEACAKALANGAARGREIVQASASIHADVLERELQDIETRLREEAARRTEARASEVRAKLDDDLYAERGRLNQEFDTFKDKTFRECFLSLLNIQMKLKLLKLPEVERKALQEKLANLTAEMQVKIEAKQREVDAAFAAYAEKRRAEAEAEIEEFRTDQERHVSLKLKEEQDRLERGLRERLLAMDLSLPADAEEWQEEAARRAKIELSARLEQLAREFAAREAAFTEKWEKLKARWDAIYAWIQDDVMKAAREVERSKGIKVTVLGPSEAVGARATPDGCDLTEQALKIIRDR